MKRILGLAAAAWVGWFATSMALATPEGEARWKARMGALSAVLTELMPDLASSARFNAAENRQRIAKNAELLGELSHALKDAHAPSQDDPSVGFISNLFASDAREAQWAIENGRLPYARALLFNVTSSCIACHTRTSAGTALPPVVLTPDERSLTPFERAILHAAARRFDQAFDELLDIVGDPRAPFERGLDWDRAASAALVLAVRTRSDPASALRVADAVLASPSAPPFMKEDALAWKKDALSWKNEARTIERSEQALFQRAQALVEEARANRRHCDRANSVLYLRATTLLHDQLNVAPSGKRTAEALHLLGVSYEALELLEVWALHPMYYDACIRRVRARRSPTPASSATSSRPIVHSRAVAARRFPPTSCGVWTRSKSSPTGARCSGAQASSRSDML